MTKIAIVLIIQMVMGVSPAFPQAVVKSSGAGNSSSLINEKSLADDLTKIKSASRQMKGREVSTESVWLSSQDKWTNLVKGGKASVPILSKELKDKNTDWRVRAIIASSVLPQINDKDAIKDLKALLSDKTEDIALRSAAADGLGNMGGESALEGLRQSIDDNPNNPKFQASIIRGLGKAGTKKDGALIAKRLNYQDSYVKVIAVRELQRVAVRNNDLAQLEPLVPMVGDATFEDRNVAIKLLGEAKYRPALPAIAKVANNKAEDYIYRCASAEALGNIGGDDADVVLLQLAADSDQLVRMYAVEGLSKGNYSAKKISVINDAIASARDLYVKGKMQKFEKILQSKQ
ncbi:MAG: HEAT repeat domain-containing protein [Elusimicrobia bacterium]|nr:HEAT repeat domain-containing protein [Elusimicrobiota bacterium]